MVCRCVTDSAECVRVCQQLNFLISCIPALRFCPSTRHSCSSVMEKEEGMWWYGYSPRGVVQPLVQVSVSASSACCHGASQVLTSGDCTSQSGSGLYFQSVAETAKSSLLVVYSCNSKVRLRFGAGQFSTGNNFGRFCGTRVLEKLPSVVSAMA